MSKKQMNLIKLAKVAYVISKVIRILIFVAIAAMLALFVFVIIKRGEGAASGGIFSGTTGEVMASLGGIVSDIEIGYAEVACLLSSAIIAAIIITIALYYLGLIFKAIAKEESPFDFNNIKRLKYAGICIALLSIIPSIVEVSAGFIFRVSGLFRMQVDLAYIVLAFFFFCLAYIFEYGAELQTQSDETL